MIAPGVGDCSVTKGQHRKAAILGGLWSYGTPLPELVFALRTAAVSVVAMFRQLSRSWTVTFPQLLKHDLRYKLASASGGPNEGFAHSFVSERT
jgi:hypothetical protein